MVGEDRAQSRIRSGQAQFDLRFVTVPMGLLPFGIPATGIRIPNRVPVPTYLAQIRIHKLTAGELGAPSPYAAARRPAPQQYLSEIKISATIPILFPTITRAHREFRIVTEPLPAPPPLKPRRTARDRLVRRRRIMDRLREGRSYEEIAEAEGLSRERIRQIVVEALAQREVDAQRDHAQLQMLRLAPALRLAAKGVAEGDRRAIAELVRVLDRLDKYQATGGVPPMTKGRASGC